MDALNRPDPFTGNGTPTFTIKELALWFSLCATKFGIFLWWLVL